MGNDGQVLRPIIEQTVYIAGGTKIYVETNGPEL